MAALPPDDAVRRSQRRSPGRAQLGLLAACTFGCYAAVWLPSGTGLREVAAVSVSEQRVEQLPAAPVIAPRETSPPAAEPQRVAKPQLIAAVAEPALRIHRAREQLLAGCMRAHGFDYAPRPGPFEVDPNRARLAALSAPQRHAFEEALKGGEVDATGRRKPEVVTVELGDGSLAVWDRGSCRAYAERELYGDDLTHQHALWAAEQRALAAEAEARKDPEFRESHALYRGCLHELRGPDLAPDDAADDWAEHEQLTAATDATCRDETELDSRWQAALARANAALADSAAATAQAELERLEARALARADFLLGGPETP